MKEIKLTNSTEIVAVVDDEDFDRINQHRWFLSSNGYIIRHKGSTFCLMHREVLNVVDSNIDHINRCKWDNCKHNLRLANQGTNRQNSTRKNTTGFKGVTFNSRYNRYIARITINHVEIYLGCFITAEDAAHAYDTKAVELYGTNALTNKKIHGTTIC
jgi:hypothetical protein